MTEYHFGGAWTELKLDAVGYYLQCYMKALSQKSLDLWYVDALLVPVIAQMKSSLADCLNINRLGTQALAICPPGLSIRLQTRRFTHDNWTQCTLKVCSKNLVRDGVIRCVSRRRAAQLATSATALPHRKTVRIQSRWAQP